MEWLPAADLFVKKFSAGHYPGIVVGCCAIGQRDAFPRKKVCYGCLGWCSVRVADYVWRAGNYGWTTASAFVIWRTNGDGIGTFFFRAIDSKSAPDALQLTPFPRGGSSPVERSKCSRFRQVQRLFVQ